MARRPTRQSEELVYRGPDGERYREEDLTDPPTAIRLIDAAAASTNSRIGTLEHDLESLETEIDGSRALGALRGLTQNIAQLEPGTDAEYLPAEVEE